MKKKYFIAIVLTDHLLEKSERIKLDLFNSYGLKGALRSPAHITLHRPFEWKEEKEDLLINSLSSFSYEAEFNISLEGFNCFEPRVIYIDVMKNEHLYLLHNKLTSFVKSNLKIYNEAEDMRGFHPHVTIAFRDLKKPLFYKLWPQFKESSFSENFTFNRFQLLKLNEKWEILHSFNI